ncbi:MAG: L-rhamnose mutarotase [Chloroflexota bacterium]
MEKIAFKMRLREGCADEYERRHTEIWPELVDLLRMTGIRDYSIYLDEETNTLFAVLWRSDDHKMDQLPESPTMRRWWDYMADLMEVNPDRSPITVPLRQVFHLE